MINPIAISTDISVMRAMVMTMLEHDLIKWRHHGIGVLQGYISENTQPEIRLHIWSKLLLKPGMNVSGDIHDHRFELESHVLAGTIYHEEIEATPSEYGTHSMLQLTHARAAAGSKFHGPTEQLPGKYLTSSKLYEVKEGYCYSFEKQKFHRSPFYGDPREVAITVVAKYNQCDTPARILYPTGIPPIMAFGHDMDNALIKEVILRAKYQLERSM